MSQQRASPHTGNLPPGIYSSYHNYHQNVPSDTKHSGNGFSASKENVYPNNSFVDPRYHDSNSKYLYQQPTPVASFQTQSSFSYQKAHSVTVPPTQTSYNPNQDHRGTPKAPEPPAQPPTLNHSVLLLSLADEYFTAAYGLGSAPDLVQCKDEIQEYYKRIAGGLGCLQAVVEKCKIQPEQEATIRLRYATVLFEETEDLMEAEDWLNKGIAIASRHKFFDLKYNMQHLLVRILFQSSPSAALKHLDGILREAEAYEHVAWVYAFRFQKVSLHLESELESRQDIKAASSTLKSIISTAEKHGDVAILAISSTMRALICLKISHSRESFEEAQRSLAKVRSLETNPVISKLPQLKILLSFVDLGCYLQHFDSAQGLHWMQEMQNALTTIPEASQWMADGSFLIPLNKERMPFCSRKDGIVRLDERGVLVLTINWMPKDDIYNVGYLLSAMALAHRNSLDGQKSEQMLQEGIKRENYARKESDKVPGSLISSTTLQLWRQHLSAYMHLHLAFLLYTRSARDTAGRHLDHLYDVLGSWSTKPPALGQLSELLLATYHQSEGHLDTALACLARLSTSSLISGSSSNQIITDIALIAALNSLLIIRHPNYEDRHKIEILSAQLSQHCPHHPNRQIQSAYNLVNATLPLTTTIIGTKQSLHLALEAARATQNIQLTCMILNIMSWKFFQGVVGEQAEKSARASQNTAKKVGDKLWMCLSAGVVWEHLEAAGRTEEAELCWEEGCQVALSLPLDVRKATGLGDKEAMNEVEMQEAG